MQNRGLFGFLVFTASVLLAALLTVPNAPAAQRPCLFAVAMQQDASSPTVPRGKKLVMKDGTFQIVSSYQLDGDRVRYFSVERSEWEEIPASLVDWPATKQAEADEEKAGVALTNKIKAGEEAAKVPLEVDASFEVVPGVFLPPGQGFFILDGQAISPLKQSPASTKLNKRHFVEQVVVPLPVIPLRTSVDLPGRHASFRITNPTPEFYFRTTDLSEPQIELLLAPVRGDKRHIENIDTLFGQQNHKGKTISMQEWRVAKGLYRFTLGQSLAPGEYALAQFSPKEGINLLLWDFGVDARRKQTNTKK
ncbi:MAG: hypothetical protein WBE86_01340 [Candidatus Acidiferrales bacterium]